MSFCCGHKVKDIKLVHRPYVYHTGLRFVTGRALWIGEAFLFRKGYIQWSMEWREGTGKEETHLGQFGLSLAVDTVDGGNNGNCWVSGMGHGRRILQNALVTNEEEKGWLWKWVTWSKSHYYGGSLPSSQIGLYGPVFNLIGFYVMVKLQEKNFVLSM